MQLTLENPDYRYALRGVRADAVLVNEAWQERSFLLTPMQLVADWRPRDVAGLQADDMEPILALEPAVVLLGSGSRLQFPAPDVMAACLTRGIGIEVMDNAAVARTFNVLATEGRRVLAAFILPGTT